MTAEREKRIDFENEFFNVVGPTISDAIAWARSIAERVEFQTMKRWVPNWDEKYGRIYSSAPDAQRASGEKNV